MNFLSGLGNFAGGTATGLDQGSIIAQRAQQIQAAQFALDQQKQQVAAQGAAFMGLLQGGQGGGAPPPAAGQGPDLSQLGGPELGGQQAPGPQPMPPGQPSTPAPQTPAPQTPPLQPAPGAVLQGPSAPQPPQGAPPAPSPDAQPGGGAPANTSQIDPTDPQAGVKVVEMIARQVKAANPNLPPQQLLMATEQIINMSKGMAPQLRAGAQVIIQDIKDKAAGDRNAASNASRETVAAGHDATSSANTDKRVAATERGQDISLTRTGMAAKAAMDRAVAVQGMITARVKSGQVLTAREKAIAERSKIVTSELTDATKRLAQLKNPITGAMPPDDDPRMKAINKQIQSATEKLKLLETATNVQPDDAGGGAPARPTATDAKGNKVEYDGQKWVPAQKSSATQ